MIITCQPGPEEKIIDHRILPKKEIKTENIEDNINIFKDSLYKVIGVGDGDTYDILVNKTKVRLRMNAIDAPERGMPYYQVSKKHFVNE